MKNDPVTVLLVEDNPDHAELIRRSFKGNRNDMKLVIVGSQAEALEAIEGQAPSVVLSDYNLPDGTGLDILRRYLADGATKPPFVLLTSHGDETIAVEAMKAGATDYIVKSERSLTSLPDVCRALIGGYRQRLEKERLELRLFAELQANEIALSNAKLRLEKNEELLNRAQEMAHVGCWELEVATDTLYWSDEVYRIIGLEPQQIEASMEAYLQAVHPDDRARVAGVISASASDGLGGFRMEYRVLRKIGGETRFVQAKCDHLKNAQGKVTRWVGIIHDITDRKRVEERIQQSEEKFSKAFNNAPIMISFSNLRDGTYLDVNKKFCELTGFSSDEAIGKTSVEIRLITPEDRQRVVEELAQNGQISGIELNLNAKDGKPITVLYHGEVISVDGIQHLLSISVDISGHRHLEEQLRQSQKMEAIGQLAGGVAHDFNNILTVIMGYGNILKMEDTLDGEGQEAVEQILSSAERAAQLTHGLLAFSRKQIMSSKNLNLNDIVHRVQSFLVRTIGENIQFNAVYKEANLNVCVDSSQIEQILINLATNARDAMPKGGTLTIQTELQELDDLFVSSHGCGSRAQYAVMTVSDNGAGMDKETQSRIFEPFFTTKKIGKGTGLGMAIVYGIVQQHKGFIYVYSEEGVGTTFRIYLPISELPQALEEKQRPEQPRGGSETILVAEDEPGVRKLVENILKRYGYRVILAEDGQDCVDKFVAHRGEVDLILMDMIMPGKNGIEAYQEIRSLQPGVKVLYSSGYASDFIKTHEVNEEEIEIVMKPVKPLELLRLVREMLDR